MKILYALQATGNGHIVRAIEMIPHLAESFDIDILISGTQGDIPLPYIIKYKHHGLSFIFGKKGGVDVRKSIVQTKPIQLIKDINSCPVENYDLIINDFEPISAWACKLKKRKCIGLSHQAAFLSQKTPRPKKRHWFSEQILKNYAPVDNYIGIHYLRYGKFIETPIIRQAIRNLNPKIGEHVTVYLPSYSEESLIAQFHNLSKTEFHVFSKSCKSSYRSGNVLVFPVGSKQWFNSLESAYGVIMGAGFEGPSEALHLGKRLMVIPMKNQYEQQCNATALKSMGVTVEPSIRPKFYEKVEKWMDTKPLKKAYAENSNRIMQRIIGFA